MYVVFLTFFMISIIGLQSSAVSVQADVSEEYQASVESIFSKNGKTYFNALSSFLNSNKSYSGNTVSDSNLGLPSSYNNAGWLNFIDTTNGIAYIYPSSDLDKSYSLYSEIKQAFQSDSMILRKIDTSFKTQNGFVLSNPPQNIKSASFAIQIKYK